jgi:hypothetical protein
MRPKWGLTVGVRFGVVKAMVEPLSAAIVGGFACLFSTLALWSASTTNWGWAAFSYAGIFLTIALLEGGVALYFLSRRPIPRAGAALMSGASMFAAMAAMQGLLHASGC